MKLYQAQVAAGMVIASAMEILQITAPSSLSGVALPLFEAGSFIFCCAGLAGGARDMRLAFEALGRDKARAKRDLAFMRARVQLQITAVVAVVALGVVAARRFNISILVPLAASALYGISLPLLNRWLGWAPSGE